MPIIKLDGTISGSLASLPTINGSVSSLQSVTGALSNAGNSAGDVYHGAYTAIPTFEQQVFATRGRLMQDDFGVTAIEVSSVSNPSGGNTIYIGGII